MIKYSDIPGVKVHKSMKSALKAVSKDLEEFHKSVHNKPKKADIPPKKTEVSHNVTVQGLNNNVSIRK